MISRVTIFSLLLALMLGIGIRMWYDSQRDACTPYLSGDNKAPTSEWVESGTRQIAVPCRDWFMRQPLRIQILYLLDGGLSILFVLNALSDLRAWFEMRQRRRDRVEEGVADKRQ